MFLAFILVSIGLLLMGPSELIGFPDEIWLLYIGTGLIGLASGFVFIPILPEVIESVYINLQLVENSNKDTDNIINDKCAALYGLFYAIGAILSPLIGSIVYNHKSPGPGEQGDWKFTCDVFGIASAAYSIIFLVFNILPDIHNEKKQRNELLSRQNETQEKNVIDKDCFLNYSINHYS